ncbi:MAG: 3-hydroxyacyl-ACP dehydratase FabZ [Candidatus Omnitrophota bacterium]|nr:3-hydroxyacyl-ACP dehydratase FabZ [Candidatus Omnitrophota bacterium]
MSAKMMNIKDVMRLIPHRYPFLLVDRVIDFEKGKSIKAIKNVTINEPFFQGHFPGEPIMPGVLIIEAMAQAGGILAMMEDETRDKLAFFMTINNAKFRKPVVPGDQLFFHVYKIKQVRGNIVQLHGDAGVDGKVVCEADLMFSVVDREKESSL